MRLIRDFHELSEPPHASVVTVGNFDGVHLAHQQLLRRVVECARPAGAVATAMTFDPHPVRILSPDRASPLLTSLPQKARLIEKLGIDLLVVLPFTEQLAQLSPKNFVHKVLVQNLHPISVHVGPNFRFGYRQAGNTQVLGELAREAGFKIEVLPMLELRGERVSSTRIRQLLAEGRVGIAGRLLGRPYANAGAIVRGQGVGHRQTVPTLNLAPIEELIPKLGVYVTRTRLGSTLHDSVTNVGHKPTFGEHRLTVECHLLDFAGEINETEMEVEYLYRLRDERKFPDPASLKAQIQKDAGRALQYFRLLPRIQRRRSRKAASGIPQNI
jgi:riboflavin kinase / FMN adenylyltransferase